MRVPFLDFFLPSPFERVMDHAKKVGACGPIFLKAVDSYLNGDCDTFEMLKEEIRDIEAQCDLIKRNIRSHLPPRVLMPVEKPLFFGFLREADKVVDCIKNSLYWISYFNRPFPELISRDYLLLVKEVHDFLGLLPEMVETTHKYFVSRQQTDRILVKDIVKEIRFRERESDDVEKAILIRLCADEDLPPKTFFIMVRLVETTGDIADHLENSADMIRAMVAR
jgi:predicted phosphate transport protein (TIGR00153 family)